MKLPWLMTRPWKEDRPGPCSLRRKLKMVATLIYYYFCWLLAGPFWANVVDRKIYIEFPLADKHVWSGSRVGSVGQQAGPGLLVMPDDVIFSRWLFKWSAARAVSFHNRLPWGTPFPGHRSHNHRLYGRQYAARRALLVISFRRSS